MGHSLLVLVPAFILEIVAFGLAIAAATKSSHVTVQYDNPGGGSFTCDYRTGSATGLSVAAGVLLLLGHLLITIGSRCMCSFHLKRGWVRIAALILLILSWLTFLIAELFIFTGSARGTYQLKAVVSRHRNHCNIIRQVIFGIAASFIFLTLVFGELYYLCYVEAKNKSKAHGIAEGHAPHGVPKSSV